MTISTPLSSFSDKITREGVPSNGMNTKLFFLCLFVYQLLFIFQGIDLSDEGFIATFYQQIFNNPEHG